MHKLEKLNSSIDIIPLQQHQQCSTVDGRRGGGGGSGGGGGGGGATAPPPLRSAAASVTMEKARTGNDAVFRDPMLISRVRTYLYENEDKVYIDVTEMADHLQRKYRDYRNKKRGPFRAMVRRAYDEITENLTKQGDQPWQDDEDEIDIELDSQVDAEVPPDYMEAYKRLAGRQNGNSSDKELIDISSDDDQPKSIPSFAKAQEKESMEVEPVHFTKRQCLSPGIEKPKTIVPQSQETVTDAKTSRLEKSRKRTRDKDNISPFETTIKKKPRDIAITNPTVKFSDIGGITKILESIVNLLLHLKYPEVYVKLGISPPRGILLHGPPGCGKTLLAHAIAGELQLPLLKVAAPELVAGVSGESEQRIRDVFEQAVAIAPCVVFLDEIDAVVSDRATSQRGMEKRIVSQLLLCLDELSLKENGNKVLLVGATNRPEALDPALRRAGRFDREISLGIPDKEARAAILAVHTAKVSLSPEIDLRKIAALTPGFVGADLVALIREAAMAAVNRTLYNLRQNKLNTVVQNEPCNETIVVEEDKKEPVSEQDISDIIIEDEVPASTEKLEAESTVNKVESQVEGEAATSTTVEESKLSEDPPCELPKSPKSATQPSEPSTSDPPSSTKETLVEPTATVTPTDIASPEVTDAATVERTADVTVDSTEPTSTPAEVTLSEIKEIKPVIQQMQVVIPENSGQKLADLLKWLHDEPPLTPEQLSLICVEENDFDVALKNVQPSAKREGFATVPDVTWDDIGSLQDIRQELQMTIIAPIRHAEQFASLGLTTPSGVLLCGPPGCGKTLLAKAIANEAGINFISVKGPELLNMYVGESEKAVRQCFVRARNSAPCVIFFDELDALCPKRSEGDNSATSRVVNQLLTEMDGVEGRKGVFLMAASNRPDIIDPAILRPGRLDKILYVGLPSAADRVDILKALTKNGTKPKLAAGVNLEDIANDERCNGLTGADLAALVKEAGNEVMREIISGLPSPIEICAQHIYTAFDKIRPSVQEKELRHYEHLQKLYSIKKNQNTDVQMSLVPPIEATVEAMET